MGSYGGCCGNGRNPMAKAAIFGGSSYDPDAQSFFNRTPTQYDGTHKQGISDFIAGIKSDNAASTLASICDIMYFLGSPTADNSIINVVSSSFTGIPVLSPAFVASQGYTSDGATSYIDTQYNPNTDKIAVSLNDMGCIFYSRSNVVENKVNMGCYTAVGNPSLYLQIVNNATSFSIVNGNDAVVGSVGAIANTIGLFSFKRSLNTVQSLYQNGVLVGDDTHNSTSIPSANIYLLALNGNGTAAFFTSMQTAFACVIKGSINQAAFYTRFQALQAAFGW